MTQHVHVRVNGTLAISEDGELVEQSHCRCGATWTKTYRANEADSDQ